MGKSDFELIIERPKALSNRYHGHEFKHHRSEWMVEEDPLTFRTDAGLVGRLTIAKQGRCPKGSETNPS